mmetsp:Transcript_6976/g.27432  ORF Transcript_6976/g.27432 Transcript_6976/m.27432 type:complete len:735 (-) Transcript_6976:576-2780(-)
MSGLDDAAPPPQPRPAPPAPRWPPLFPPVPCPRLFPFFPPSWESPRFLPCDAARFSACDSRPPFRFSASAPESAPESAPGFSAGFDLAPAANANDVPSFTTGEPLTACAVPSAPGAPPFATGLPGAGDEETLPSRARAPSSSLFAAAAAHACVSPHAPSSSTARCTLILASPPLPSLAHATTAAHAPSVTPPQARRHAASESVASTDPPAPAAPTAASADARASPSAFLPSVSAAFAASPATAKAAAHDASTDASVRASSSGPASTTARTSAASSTSPSLAAHAPAARHACVAGLASSPDLPSAIACARTADLMNAHTVDAARVPSREPAGDATHAPSADALAPAVAPPAHSDAIDRKISTASAPRPPAWAARSARSCHAGSELADRICGCVWFPVWWFPDDAELADDPGCGCGLMNEAARAAAKTSTARDDNPPRSHAVMSDAYDACGRSVRTPLARVWSDAILASRLAAKSAASAAIFASAAAVLPERIAAAVSTDGGASLARASFASASMTTAFAAASASSSRRASCTSFATPTTSSICRKLPAASHAETHEAAVDAPGVWSGSLSRMSRQMPAASPACALPGAAHACIAAAYSAGSGSTALHPARYVAIASSSRPPVAHAPMTAAYECLSGLIPSLRISSKISRASSARPALSHALSTELYVMTFASTFLSRICRNTSSASSHRRPFSHAAMTVPYVMASGSTPADWHSRNTCRALSSCLPLAHADMSAE